MPDKRKKNVIWNLATNPDGTTPHGDAELAVLMDIRDELQQLNRILNCNNFLRIPAVLDAISKNTKPKRRRRRARILKAS
jgi:hypothetical protein